MNKEKVVCILSGGMDSTTLLYDIVAQGKEVYALSFDYNQRHKKELECAKKTCKKLGIIHKVVDLSVLNQLAPSCLTRDKWQVPEGHYESENMKQTVVPNRNMVLLSLAGAYAMGLNAKAVYYGAHSGDHFIYCDCRPEFVEAMKNVLKIADFNPVELRAPYIGINKGDIVKKGIKLKVPYQDTWTCYKGLKKACRKCGSCQERLEAFAKNKIKDPVRYENE